MYRYFRKTIGVDDDYCILLEIYRFLLNSNTTFNYTITL